MCLQLQGAAPLKFAIFFAGALIRDRNLSYIYKEKVTLPSVHIIGDKDYVKEVGHHHSISLTRELICFLMKLFVSDYLYDRSACPEIDMHQHNMALSHMTG